MFSVEWIRAEGKLRQTDVGSSVTFQSSLTSSSIQTKKNLILFSPDTDLCLFCDEAITQTFHWSKQWAGTETVSSSSLVFWAGTPGLDSLSWIWHLRTRWFNVGVVVLTSSLTNHIGGQVGGVTCSDHFLYLHEGGVDLFGELSHRLVGVLVGKRVDVDLHRCNNTSSPSSVSSVRTI